MSGTVRIAILANGAQAKAALQDVGKESSKLGSILKTGIVGGAVVAGAALGAMAANAISGARESAQIHRVLESQIKSMGEASRKAFTGATKFAEDYGKQIGKDDDDILKVVNKLSTFPAAFGKGTLGAEAMRRATKAAFDLEAAGVGTAEGNIIGLGKALDNPVKGLTALSKSGVSFTTQQQEQIKNYVKQGKLAEAQRVLLAGIETNAKGAATVQADGLSRAKVALDGFAEGLATQALPLLDKFGNWFATSGVDLLGKAFDGAKAGISALVTVLGNPVFQVFAGSVLAVVVAMKVYSTTLAVIRAATAAYAAVQAALNVVLTANPIGLIILAIVALVAAIVIAYKRSETFRAIVQAAMRGVMISFRAVLAVFQAVWGWISRNWRLLFAILTGPIGLAVRFILTKKDAIIGAFKAIPGRIRAVFSGARTILSDAGRQIIDGFVSSIRAGFDKVKAQLDRLTGLLPDWKGPAARDRKILRGPADLIMGGFLDQLESRYSDVRRSLGGFTSSLSASAAGTGGVGALGLSTAPLALAAPSGSASALSIGFDPTSASAAADPLARALMVALRELVRVQHGGSVVKALSQPGKA